MKNKAVYLVLIVVSVILLALFVLKPQDVAAPQPTEISSFEDCVAAGNPVMESYPPQCIANGQNFTQNIGNELEKVDLIKISNPRPATEINSPLEVTGEARGTWYFEASFPVYLYDENNNRIATGIAQAQGEWMTEEFVPFVTTLEFTAPVSKKGYLVLERSNPSGLPENADELRVPVFFE
jgi:hypothetical protein